MDAERPAGAFIKTPVAVARRHGLSHSAKVLYTILKDYAGQSDECWPAEADLADDLELSVRRMRDYIHELEDAGLIQSWQRGDGRSKGYRLLPDSSGRTAASALSRIARQDAPPQPHSAWTETSTLNGFSPDKNVHPENFSPDVSVHSAWTETSTLIKEEREPGNENQESDPMVVVDEGGPPPPPAQPSADGSHCEDEGVERQALLAREVVRALLEARGLPPADRAIGRLLAAAREEVVLPYRGRATLAQVRGCIRFMRSKPFFADRPHELTPARLGEELGPWLALGEPEQYEPPDPRGRGRSAQRRGPPGTATAEIVPVCKCKVSVDGRGRHMAGCGLQGIVHRHNYVDIATDVYYAEDGYYPPETQP